MPPNISLGAWEIHAFNISLGLWDIYICIYMCVTK